MEKLTTLSLTNNVDFTLKSDKRMLDYSKDLNVKIDRALIGTLKFCRKVVKKNLLSPVTKY